MVAEITIDAIFYFIPKKVFKIIFLRIQLPEKFTIIWNRYCNHWKFDFFGKKNHLASNVEISTQTKKKVQLKSTWVRIVTSRFRRIWLDFLLCFIVPCFYCHQQTPFDWAVNTKVQRNELACDCAFYRNKRDVGSSQFHSTFHEAVILQHFWWVEDCQQDSKLTRR